MSNDASTGLETAAPIEAPSPIRIHCGDLGQLDQAWRALQSQDVLERALLHTDDGNTLLAFRSGDGHWTAQHVTAQGCSLLRP